MFLTILTLAISPWALLLLPLLYYTIPYIRHSNLRRVPGPFVASFTNLWLMYHSRRGQRYLAVDEVHRKYGPVVRIQPNQVSIADTCAIPIIYGHGNAFFEKRYRTPIPLLSSL
jgi:benzoate 4-monooxygenase